MTCTLSPGFGGLSARKRGEGQNAFGLESDVENDGVGGHGNYGAFASLTCRLALLREWLCSYSEKISLNDSTGD